MLSVQMGSRHRRDEKLRAVCIRSSISHAQQERLGVVHRERLVLKLFAIDRLASGPITSSKVTYDQQRIGSVSISPDTKAQRAITHRLGS
jgi:hypothetical protein